MLRRPLLWKMGKTSPVSEWLWQRSTERRVGTWLLLPFFVLLVGEADAYLLSGVAGGRAGEERRRCVSSLSGQKDR